MTKQNRNQQGNAGDKREPPPVQQQGEPDRTDRGPASGQAARDEGRLDRDQVRDDPSEPRDESRLG